MTSKSDTLKKPGGCLVELLATPHGEAQKLAQSPTSGVTKRTLMVPGVLKVVLGHQNHLSHRWRPKAVFGLHRTVPGTVLLPHRTVQELKTGTVHQYQTELRTVLAGTGFLLRTVQEHHILPLIGTKILDGIFRFLFVNQVYFIMKHFIPGKFSSSVLST